MGATIVLVRIDDRLIHGQVVSAWLKQYPCDLSIVVDDGVAKDLFMQRVIRSAAPMGIKAEAMSIADTIAYVNDPANDGAKLTLITKVPDTIEGLIAGGIHLDSVIIGGMGIRAGRQKLNRNVYANEDEIASMRRLEALGVRVGYQLVPQYAFVPLDEMLS